MAITAKDFAALQSGVNSISEGRDNKTLQILKDYLSGQRTKSDLETANSYVEDNAKKGRKVSAKVGDVTLGQSETDPTAKLSKDSSMEANRLRNQAKTLTDPIQKQVDALDLVHQFLDNPNSFDQKKLSVMQARLVEGPGQRLLDSVIQAMGGGQSTLAGTAQEKMNYLMGTAKSGLTPQQRNAMRESTFKYQSALEKDSEDSLNKFKAYAPALAPSLHATGALNPLIDAEVKPIASRFEGLKQRQADYLQQAGPKTQINQPNAQFQPVLGPIDKLKAFFGGGQPQPAQAAPQAKTPVKKLYSPSQNKTKVQYNDGTEEVVDGQQ